MLRGHWENLSDAERLLQIDRIVLSANRQHRLVEDLLMLARLDTEVPAMQVTSMLLDPLVSRAADDIRMIYRNQVIHLKGESGTQVLADPERVTQIMVNLLDNAAKYSPEGSPIHVSWHRDDAMVLVKVRDEGEGVPEHTRPYLFTRFGRGKGSRIRAGHVGTGLGLYLSRRLAEAMNGSLDLEATGPIGSIFTLRLPGAPGY